MRIDRITAMIGAVTMMAAIGGCDVRRSDPPARDTTRTAAAPPDTVQVPGQRRDTIAGITDANALPVTLPLLDAFFADSTFPAELKSRLALTDEQVTQLRTAAREETARLNEAAGDEYSGTTTGARQLAADRIRGIIGDQKALELAGYLRERWNTGGAVAGAPGDSASVPTLSAGVNAIPSDTRVVVNAPAYRMDLFQDGKLVKSYKVGIGYPEFPLPTATLRYAKSIIYNPTWTPPDEPWVEGSGKVQVGKKVPAGSSLNPLGPIKIPIGLPSLIHGGKQPARLGSFASHGCVGMTDQQIKDFALRLAGLSGTQLTDTTAAAYMKRKTETKEVPLSRPVPIELRYETMVVENGVLHVYRDVYDRNTNTEEGLRRVLSAYGVTPEQLTEQERTQVMNALREMSRDAQGKIDSAGTDSAKTAGGTAQEKKPASGKVTRNVKGQKEIAIPIAALQGKGYPAPAEYDPSGSEKKIAGTTAPKGAMQRR